MTVIIRFRERDKDFSNFFKSFPEILSYIISKEQTKIIPAITLQLLMYLFD
jgi:hypothetical protein